MKQMIYLEFSNCIKSTKYKITFILLYLISISAFLINCSKSYGCSLSLIRSASDMSINMGTTSGLTRDIIILLLPLLALLLYSDSFLTDLSTGVYKNITTRISKKKYMAAKIIVTFLVTLFTFFIILFMNEVLTAITFPLKGYDNNFAFPAYDIGYYNYNKKLFLDLVRVENPYLYNMIFMVIISLVAALLAVLSLMISFIVKGKKVQIFFNIFIIYILSDICLDQLNLSKFSIKTYLYSLKEGSTSILLSWISILLLVIIGMFIYEQRQDLL